MFQFRNPEFNAHGGLDCEINHPKFGWVPYTVSQTEAPDFYDEVLAANPAEYVTPSAPPPLTPAEIAGEVEALTEAVMNGNIRDKAMGMVMADMWRAAQPAPKPTVAKARADVRARYKQHLETLRGI